MRHCLSSVIITTWRVRLFASSDGLRIGGPGQERERSALGASAVLSRTTSPLPPRSNSKIGAMTTLDPGPIGGRKKNQLVGRAWLVGAGGGLTEKDLLMQVADLRAEAESATKQAAELKDKNHALAKVSVGLVWFSSCSCVEVSVLSWHVPCGFRPMVLRFRCTLCGVWCASVRRGLAWCRFVSGSQSKRM